MNSGDNDCVLVSNPNEDFYDDLKALSSEPVDEDLEQLRVSPIELFEHVEGTRIGTRILDIKRRCVGFSSGLETSASCLTGLLRQRFSIVRLTQFPR